MAVFTDEEVSDYRKLAKGEIEKGLDNGAFEEIVNFCDTIDAKNLAKIYWQERFLAAHEERTQLANEVWRLKEQNEELSTQNAHLSNRVAEMESNRVVIEDASTASPFRDHRKLKGKLISRNGDEVN